MTIPATQPFRSAAVGLLLLAGASASAQDAEESRFDVGVRGVLIFAKGEPSNDMVGTGLIGRWALRDGWHVGIAYDSVTFDYETPNEVLGIASTEVVDPSNDLSRISVLVERRYADSDRDWNWFWTAGVGLASVDVGPNAAGTTPEGGTFDIVTTADDEVHIFAGGGLTRAIAEKWTFETALTVQHHDTDYRLVDRVSGATGSIGSHTGYGLNVGISYRF